MSLVVAKDIIFEIFYASSLKLLKLSAMKSK